MRAELLHRQDIDTQLWDELVDSSSQGSPMLKSWYIDAISADWSAVIVFGEDDLFLAGMPLLVRSKYFIKYSLQPILAKYWGVCLRNNVASAGYKTYLHERKVLELVIKKLPQLHVFNSNLHPSSKYALPYLWAGYETYAKFTAIIDLAKGYENIYSQYPKDLKRELRRAEESGLTLIHEDSPESVIKVLELNKDAGRKMLAEDQYSTLTNLFKVAKSHNAASVLSVYSSEQDILLASAMYLHDSRATYSMVNNVAPAGRQYFAAQYLTDKIISEACERSQVFDFMGLMDKDQEYFFKKFGPETVPYLQIYRNKLPVKII